MYSYVLTEIFNVFKYCFLTRINSFKKIYFTSTAFNASYYDIINPIGNDLHSVGAFLDFFISTLFKISYKLLVVLL